MQDDNRISCLARDVVPGMIWCGEVVQESRPDGSLWIIRIGGYSNTGSPNSPVSVKLPGPSPRELLPEIYDLLRPWPIPLAGEDWKFDSSECVWWTEDGDVVSIDTRGKLIGSYDALACFYLPTERQP